MLVCFATFVLTVDMSLDYLLSYEPLGCCASLDTLHYVQPRCSPTLYPSKIASSTPLSSMAIPGQVVVEDESDASIIEKMSYPKMLST
jgi:hypothetical protein